MHTSDDIRRNPTRALRAEQARRTRTSALAIGLFGLLALGACAADTRDEAPDAPLAQQAAESAEARPPASSLSLPSTVEDPKVAPWFKVYRPTDLKATGKPLPIIAWANGGCFRSEFTWKPLFDKWTAGGFIVLALSASPSFGPLGQSNVANQKALIDWALKQNETPDSPYFGAIDTKRVIAAGNSCGGVTALGLAAQDPRVTAVFVLSGSSALGAADEKVMGNLKIPVGYIVGAKEDIAGANALADYEMLKPDVPALLVSRSAGDHITVSTDPAILAEEARISLDWLDLAVYGNKQALSTLTSNTVCTGCQAGTWNVRSKNLEKLAN